ncbi:hypothetical protein HNQ94_002214 [Salirhabdus euzebyi]|uniref:Uncharacterized protein n=1 Tax=Salirhabdus euzebyi TaxID=394506 RepID=A0A841Q5X6_9BACI|nr:hypothetical protein [Salirhabdus euzebyi]
MYVYYADTFEGPIVSTIEGNLEWKTLDWIYHSPNVVSNIPHFLPYILDLEKEPLEHRFYYDKTGDILSYTRK